MDGNATTVMVPLGVVSGVAGNFATNGCLFAVYFTQSTGHFG